MELYKFIAIINNTDDIYPFAYLPENFEGVKITQKFSWNNPIGFDPQYSIDTLRIILEDKTRIDDVFTAFGLFASVDIEVQKLNTNGFSYSTYSNFAIDFENYEMFDVYSEFPLKSISAIDFYTNLKGNEQQYILPNSNTLNISLLYTNYISLNKYIFATDAADLISVFRFIKNNDAEVYNGDSALELNAGGYDDSAIYSFGNTTPTAKIIKIAYNGRIEITTDHNMATAKIVICKNTTATILATLATQSAINTNYIAFTLDATQNITAQIYNEYDSLFIAAIITKQSGQPIIEVMTVEGYFSIDIKRETEVLVIPESNTIKNISVNALLNNFFNNNVASSIPDSIIATSSNTLTGVNNYINVKPSEFLSDICKMLGLIVNYNLNGSVSIDYAADYFNNLFSVSNAIEISSYQDLSIKYSEDLNASGVNVGSTANEYTYMPYEIDWNKELNFIQPGRISDNVIDLKLVKIRQDFTGVLNYLISRSPLNKTLTKDIFILKNTFGYRTAGDGSKIYDIATPRDVLNSWEKVLSFFFQNFGKDTLTLSSNGGTTDNLQLSGVNQLDNFTFLESSLIRPIVYSFTCLIENVDYSENIIQITVDNSPIYLFVINAEMTDNLSEQKITALKIII